jgi:hypothetical protein
MTTKAEIDAMRMMSQKPLQSRNIYDADDKLWKGPITPAYMKYNPQSLYGWKGPQVTPMHYNPTSLNDWKSPRIDYSFDDYDRFLGGVESGADISASEGGKKRKNTIKQRKSRNGRKSRRGGGGRSALLLKCTGSDSCPS